MISNRSWADYEISYRKSQMQTLTRWIRNGHSGTVIGPTGSGRGNLLGFLANRPDAIAHYLGTDANAVVLLSIDLNNLPDVDLATFYRMILRGFYETRHQLDDELQAKVISIYEENRRETDPFLPQSGLRELLLYCHARRLRVVLIMDRFHKFRQELNGRIIDTLRGLRDSFKSTLTYIIGTRQEIKYLAAENHLGELYEILDIHRCWLGPMTQADAYTMITQETIVAENKPELIAYEALFWLTGGYPALLKSACAWWVETADKLSQPVDWVAHLMADKGTQFRLEGLWTGLSEAEKMILVEMGQLHQNQNSDLAQARWQAIAETEHLHLQSLENKGLITESQPSPQIIGELLREHVMTVGDSVLGRIAYDQENGQIYQGRQQLKLSKIRFKILKHMLDHPEEIITFDELREAGWTTGKESEDKHLRIVSTITDQSIYQAVRALRKILRDSDKKRRYILAGPRAETYIFYPNGRPE